MWDTWDPTLISEVKQILLLENLESLIHIYMCIDFTFQGLFAAANIFSSLKLVYIFSVNPYLGPLQVRLF